MFVVVVVGYCGLVDINMPMLYTSLSSISGWGKQSYQTGISEKDYCDYHCVVKLETQN